MKSSELLFLEGEPSSLLLHQAGFAAACRHRQWTVVASEETPADFSRLGIIPV